MYKLLFKFEEKYCFPIKVVVNNHKDLIDYLEDKYDIYDINYIHNEYDGIDEINFKIGDDPERKYVNVEWVKYID